ncbi:hypothetical protein GGR52DRAFT_568280 [Hypoxylon sp. FL1284]|nr:hypothetical protein GGR52DRAFT_568280 [Hypoxylon sp. FL1284]
MSASGQSTPTMGADPLDFIDFSEYDQSGYQSPSDSPMSSGKAQFVKASVGVSTSPNMPSNQTLSGPSHQYDQYKQQTPFVPGAYATTHAVNESNSQITGYTLDYLNPVTEEVLDFNTVPSQSMNAPEMDMELDSFFPDTAVHTVNNNTVNPNAIDSVASETAGMPSQTSAVGRMYPGMHQQAALAKAQAQQQQQQHQILQQQTMLQQQQEQQRRRSQQAKQARPKTQLPPDSIVEQKISQLLSDMRASAGVNSANEDAPMLQLPRTKKEEDEMDEDERLLASEEGKKLSSKERRQLRNKVSARAFRSRRKEYIGQLETEIANRVSEAADLRAANRALVEENRRLSNLTRTLLSSQSFSTFLDDLSKNPVALPQLQQQHQQSQQPQQPSSRQAANGANPFAGLSQRSGQNMQQPVDSSSLDLYNYRPQVFTVMEAPETPIDAYAMSGKTSSSFEPESFPSDEEKATAPVIKLPTLPETPATVEASAESTESKTAVANLDGDLYDDETTVTSSTPVDLDTGNLASVDIFGGIELEKAFSRLELHGAEECDQDVTVLAALRRIERLAARLDPVMAKLDLLTIGLE